jgi:hypothetical protein
MSASTTGLTPADATPAPTVARTVVVHYHLYKNAGTSLDAALRHAFGNGWEAWEGDGPSVSPAQVAERLRVRPWIVALSSHRASLPAPQLEGVRVIPLVFLRHPLDRVRSVYQFARRQRADTPGARHARAMTFPAFVDWRLERRGDRSFRNFQTVRLAPGGEGATELARALDAITHLPYIGLVEAYQQSVARLRAVLDPWFPGFDAPIAWENRSAGRELSLEARLERMVRELGADRFGRLERANDDDLVLWSTVRRQYQGE